MTYSFSAHPGCGHRTIRNICITDCVTTEDYFKIIYLCGDYDHEDAIRAKLQLTEGNTTAHSPSIYNFLLYDNGDSRAFMYFWRAGKVTPETHHYMTVAEFYALFKNDLPNDVYEYW